MYEVLEVLDPGICVVDASGTARDQVGIALVKIIREIALSRIVGRAFERRLYPGEQVDKLIGVGSFAVRHKLGGYGIE